MIPNDDWILNYMRTAKYDHRTCPHAAIFFMEEKGIHYTEYEYQHLKTVINRKMKIMERYGMVRYTGETVSFNDRSKIWEVIQ